MKELKQLQADQVKQIQAEEKKQRAHLGSITPHPGHTLYEYDPATGQLAPAIFEQAPIRFGADPVAAGRKMAVVHRPGCSYVLALNLKNARRKLGLNKK